MSLTSLIRTRSNLKYFFMINFPNASAVIKAINMKTKSSTISDCLPKDSPGHIYGWVGTAFDYRARYYLKPTPFRELIAYPGGRYCSSNERFGTNLDAWVKKTQTSRKKLPDNIERDFCLLTLLLAKMDVIGRSSDLCSPFDTIGSEHFRTVIDAVSQPSIKKTLRVLDKKYSKRVLKDLIRLSCLFQESISSKISNLVLNPVFLGSQDVGGADADLIIDDDLIEIKCKKKPLTSNDLYQLIGYKLLDYDNAYKINNLYFYLGRYGEFHGCSVKKMIAFCDCPVKSIKELRNRFKRAANKDLKELKRSNEDSISALKSYIKA